MTPPRGTSLSVIIPTFNEESHITELIQHLQKSPPYEIIVADGGSTDNTVDQARKEGAQVITAQQGRAAQMNAAAHHAQGEFLLFLHADTTPPENYQSEITRILQQPNTAAGAFRFKLDTPGQKSTWVETGVHLRCRLFNTPYGDQGFFVRRDTFTKSGRFPEWPILEDLEWIKRIKRLGKVRMSPAAATTSARRWKQGGYLTTFLKHQLILLAYRFGISPSTIAKIR